MVLLGDADWLHTDSPTCETRRMRPLNNPKAIADELAILNHPLTAEERPAIVELVGQLRAADGIEEYFDLHLKLLARYLSRQRVRGELEADGIAVPGGRSPSIRHGSPGFGHQCPTNPVTFATGCHDHAGRSCRHDARGRLKRTDAVSSALPAPRSRFGSWQ